MSVAQKNKDENTNDQKEMSNTEHKACPLCGRAFEKSEISKFSKATIDGINYAFDTIDCMSIFKRLKSAYGQRLDELADAYSEIIVEKKYSSLSE